MTCQSCCRRNPSFCPKKVNAGASRRKSSHSPGAKKLCTSAKFLCPPTYQRQVRAVILGQIARQIVAKGHWHVLRYRTYQLNTICKENEDTISISRAAAIQAAVCFVVQFYLHHLQRAGAMRKKMGSTRLWRAVCGVAPQMVCFHFNSPNRAGNTVGRSRRRDADGDTRDACVPWGNSLPLPLETRLPDIFNIEFSNGNRSPARDIKPDFGCGQYTGWSAPGPTQATWFKEVAVHRLRRCGLRRSSLAGTLPGKFDSSGPRRRWRREFAGAGGRWNGDAKKCSDLS